MFASIFLIPLGVSVAAAAAVGRQNGVICETVHTGGIRLFLNDQDARFLPTDGANITLFTCDPDYPPFLIDGGNTEQYEFQQCTSNFMGYAGEIVDGPTTVTYGHIVPVDYGNCLTISFSEPNGEAGQYYYIVWNEACSTDDDESQLQQYWSLTNDGKILQLNFVGITEDGTTYDNSTKAEMLPQLDILSVEQALSIGAYTEPSFILYSVRFID